MRSLILASIGSLVLIGTASLALRIDASIAEDEYVRPEAPLVTLSESYEDGVYAFEGSVRVPTRCTGVSAAPILSEEGVIHIEVAVEEDTEACLMLPTIKEFSGEVEVEENTRSAVYVNGIKAIITETL
ncbi:hypothetical protein K2Y00_00575 [Patescibacteria group bacterium]|nr:hypothetical protein [Patescibacteria group bacterium]